MSLVTNTVGANTTATLTRTAANAKMNATLTDAAHKIWVDITDSEGIVTTSWDQSTSAQKLAQLETNIVNYMLNLAKAYNIESELKESQATSEAENAINYSL